MVRLVRRNAQSLGRLEKTIVVALVAMALVVGLGVESVGHNQAAVLHVGSFLFSSPAGLEPEADLRDVFYPPVTAKRVFGCIWQACHFGSTPMECLDFNKFATKNHLSIGLF